MPRGLLIFALCLPLAVLMGFMLSDPLMGSNMAVISGALFALLIPTILAVHHRALIWTANMLITVFFLPGQPFAWMLIAGLSFGISVLSRPLAKVKVKPVWDKPVLISLLFFLCCVITTALFTGGVGMRVFGSSFFGGRKYLAVVAAVIGFIALTMVRAPRKNVQKDVAVYTLGWITAAVGNFAYMLGPAFYFLFLLFPAGFVALQANADFAPALAGIKRYQGFGPASVGLVMFCMMRWGIRGCLQPNKLWRLGILLFAFGLGLFGGFRATVAVSIFFIAVQFFAEGLHRTKYLVGALTGAFALFGLIAVFSERLPLSVQRSLSFLPVRLNPTAVADARATMDWRFDMWQVVVRQIPDHLWIGKGYALDPTDLFFAEESLRRGFISSFETSMNSGDYHNGPLSVIVPFGILGSVAFVAFIITSLRVLWQNMKYGDPDIQNINTFLFSVFTGRFLFFMTLYGALEVEIWTFASLVGLSLSINGGLRKPQEKPRLAVQSRPAKEREAELAVI